MAGSTAQDSVVFQPDLLWSLAASFRNPAWEGEVDLFTPEDHIDGLLWTSENKKLFQYKRKIFSTYTTRWSCIQELNETTLKKKSLGVVVIKLGSFSLGRDVRPCSLEG